MRLAQKTTEGYVVSYWDGPSHAANTLDLDASHIRKCLNGKRKTHGGFVWEWVEDDVNSQLDLPFNGKPYISKKENSENSEELVGISAYDTDGTIMDIDRYCEVHGFPREDIKRYKLVAHTGTPYYNIEFKERDVISGDNIDFDSIVKKYISEVPELTYVTPKGKKGYSRLIYTDVHIGMDVNQNGGSLFGGKWDRDEVNSRFDQVASFVLSNAQGSELYIDDLGDFMDGQGQRTLRGGHELPQNMTDEEAFDLAIGTKVGLVDMLIGHFDHITINDVVNDNHSGKFSYYVSSAARSILEVKYPSKVTYVIRTKFISHYYIDDHCFIISHGKDTHQLNRPFAVKPTAENLSKIDQYCKVNGIYRNAKFIEFSKGDSHQMVFDYASSDDFDYMNYPAFSPSSAYVQVNYKKGNSGFVLQNIDGGVREKDIKYKYFDWVNDE